MRIAGIIYPSNFSNIFTSLIAGILGIPFGENRIIVGRVLLNLTRRTDRRTARVYLLPRLAYLTRGKNWQIWFILTAICHWLSTFSAMLWNNQQITNNKKINQTVIQLSITARRRLNVCLNVAFNCTVLILCRTFYLDCVSQTVQYCIDDE